MSTTAFIYLSVIGVSAISLISIVLLTLKHSIVHRLLFWLLSFSTGALLGDVFIHMIPEMAEEGNIATYSWIILIGFLASFVLEKFIHWHHCHHDDCDEHIHPVGIMNLVGDGIHNALDGILIAGSYLVSIEVGMATTLAVLLHEIPQEIGDVGVLLHSGFTRAKVVLFNVGTALMAVLGASIALGFQASIPDMAQYILPFAAGNFLYIAGSDLIPELHKETGAFRSATQLLGMLCGVGLMALLILAE